MNTVTILGIVTFTRQRMTYTTREKVIDLTSLQATVDKKETIVMTLLAGGLALVGGIMSLIGGAKRVHNVTTPLAMPCNEACR